MWCLVQFFLCYILPRRSHNVLAKRLVSYRNVVGCLRQKRLVRWFWFSFLTLLALCAILDAFFSSVCNAAIDVVGFLTRGCSVKSVSDCVFFFGRGVWDFASSARSSRKIETHILHHSIRHIVS